MTKHRQRKGTPRRSMALTLAVPLPLHDRADVVFGGDVASDPAFWMIALRRGIDGLEQEMREVKAEIERDAAESGSVVIFGAPVVIGPGAPGDDDELDGIPF